jgi:hypothetical protein
LVSSLFGVCVKKFEKQPFLELNIFLEIGHIRYLKSPGFYDDFKNGNIPL